MARRTIKFKAVVTVKKPVEVKFTTKSGDTVSFKAVKTEKQRKTVRFQTKK